MAILNFALMGIILERCVSKQKGASGLMGVGYIGRLALIALAVIWATKVDYLNYVCVIIPLYIPADFYIHTKSYEKKGKGSVRR